LEFGDVGFGWAGRRLAFEESNVLAVDLLCPFDVVSSDGTVENVVIVQNVEETAESGTPQHVVDISGGVGGFDLAFSEFCFVSSYCLKVGVGVDGGASIGRSILHIL
jgi:hypothetical protein